MAPQLGSSHPHRSLVLVFRMGIHHLVGQGKGFQFHLDIAPFFRCLSIRFRRNEGF